MDGSFILLLLTWQSGDTSNLGLSRLVPVRSGGEVDVLGISKLPCKLEEGRGKIFFLEWSARLILLIIPPFGVPKTVIDHEELKH